MSPKIAKKLSPINRAKYAAAKRASLMVEPDMKVGLGSGSTAEWLVRCLGERCKSEGLSFAAAATSVGIADLAREQGLVIRELDDLGWLDLTIDGADEIDGAFNLIKGGGGALLREKIVASASDRMVVITDASKHVNTLGAFALPVEVIPFGWESSQKQIVEILNDTDVLGDDIARRMSGGEPFATDEGNFILDLALRYIGDARELSTRLNQIAGVVENGLFLGICDQVVTGYGDGRTDLRGKDEKPKDKKPGDKAVDELDPQPPEVADITELSRTATPSPSDKPAEAAQLTNIFGDPADA